MGTRGLFGFYYKGQFYLSYNHWDSYPNGLGLNVLNQILSADLDTWKFLITQLKVVDESKPPTPEEITQSLKYTNLAISTQSTRDWYCLLDHCQGSLSRVLQAGYIINYVDGQGKPDFQEYAYVVNFDTNQFDFYSRQTLKKSVDLKVDQLKALYVEWGGSI